MKIFYNEIRESDQPHASIQIHSKSVKIFTTLDIFTTSYVYIYVLSLYLYKMVATFIPQKCKHSCWIGNVVSYTQYNIICWDYKWPNWKKNFHDIIWKRISTGILIMKDETLFKRGTPPHMYALWRHLEEFGLTTIS